MSAGLPLPNSVVADALRDGIVIPAHVIDDRLNFEDARVALMSPFGAPESAVAIATLALQFRRIWNEVQGVTRNESVSH